MQKKILITGSGGLVGSETSRFFLEKDFQVIGIDNNLRKYFFGDGGSVLGNISSLKTFDNFKNYEIDLRDRDNILKFFKENSPFDMVVHTAAQPSHDWAAKEPFTDFDVNANATLNLLESFRKYSPEGTFIFTSTNKVYGDNPNKAELDENEKRFDYSVNQKIQGITNSGINENMSLDHCKHSLFGASKMAADILCQEYGRYFDLNIGVFRGGCLTGPQHSAVELHGFLAYIIDCAVNKNPYTVFGYDGKQVRDQLHSFDVANAFYHFFKNPKKGIVYNLGGCKENSLSILETIDFLSEKFDLKLNYKYSPKNRIGDHVCYYSDMTKFRKDFPEWEITKNIKKIFDEILKAKSSNGKEL